MAASLHNTKNNEQTDARGSASDHKETDMAKIVSSWNDFDSLKRVIVGRADNSMIPPEEPATSEKVPVDSEMRGCRRAAGAARLR